MSNNNRLKGQRSIADYTGVVAALLIMGIFVSVAILANNQLSTSFTAGSAEALAAGNVTELFANFSEQLPTVGTLLGVGLILLVVIGAFAVFQTRRGL